jgi:hypothetical protein
VTLGAKRWVHHQRGGSTATIDGTPTEFRRETPDESYWIDDISERMLGQYKMLPVKGESPWNS